MLWVLICTVRLIVSFCLVIYAFLRQSTTYIWLNVKELFSRNRCDIWSLSNCNRTWSHSDLALKLTLNHLVKLAKWLSVLWVLISTVYFTVCSCHVMYAFQREFTLYVCMNVKKLLARNWRHIWSSSDCNGTRNHIHLVPKRALNHLTKLVKSLNCDVSTYLYGEFDCMFLSFHIRISDCIHTLYLSKFQGTLCS